MRPFVVVFSTESVDGRIAGPSGFSLLSCLDDFELQHELRAWADAVMVGSGTALKDDPRLNVRLVIGRSPLRVVVDGGLRVPPSARLFHGGRGVLVTTEDHTVEELKPYLDRGVEVVQAGRGRVDLARALEELHERLGVRRLLVEGGGGLICALASGGLIDELRVTVAPRLLGGGVSLLRCEGVGLPVEGVRLQLVEHRVLCGSWVHLRYRVLRY